MASTHKIGLSFIAAGAVSGVLISVLGLQRWKVPIYGILLASCAVSVYLSARRESRDRRPGGD